MIRTIRHSQGLWRHVFMTLAALAIALKVLIPPGFMAGAPTNDLPFALVLCTGQGAMVVAPGGALPSHDEHDKAPAEDTHDSPCAFAGHAAIAPPPSLAEAGFVEFPVYDYRPQGAFADMAPGRGLSAPPPPARGPPALLI